MVRSCLFHGLRPTSELVKHPGGHEVGQNHLNGETNVLLGE